MLSINLSFYLSIHLQLKASQSATHSQRENQPTPPEHAECDSGLKNAPVGRNPEQTPTPEGDSLL